MLRIKRLTSVRLWFLAWGEDVLAAGVCLALVVGALSLVGSCIGTTFFGTPGPDDGKECVSGPNSIDHVTEACYSADSICGDERRTHKVGDHGSLFEKFSALEQVEGRWYATYEHALTGKVLRREIPVCANAHFASSSRPKSAD